MERTLVILKPSAIERRLIGEVTQRFEQKGLDLIGMKMIELDDEILNIHYDHLKEKAFFKEVKISMKRCPVIVQCWEGVGAISVVRAMIGLTNGRDAKPSTIRGDFSVSSQENIIHASDSKKSAEIELKRFFIEKELFSYDKHFSYLYANSER